MNDFIPTWISVFFIVVSLTTIAIFYFINNKPNKVLAIIILWLVIQSLLSLNGFYLQLEGFPPRIPLILAPPILLILYSFLPKQKEWLLQNRNIKYSAFLHTIRIFMEIILLQLFLQKQIPELMTFEGRNFDIIAGITAPIVGYLFYKNKISNKTMLVWNVLGLLLIIFILLNGLLSVPTAIQQFGFEQPNVALLYFPFILLPSIVVPIVLYTHLSDIVYLSNEIKK